MKIGRIEEKIEKLELKAGEIQDQIRIEKEKLNAEIEKEKLKKVDELILYFNQAEIDISFEDLVDKIKNKEISINSLKGGQPSEA